MSGLLYEAPFENVLVGGASDAYLELTLGNAAIAIHLIKLSTDNDIPGTVRVVLAPLAIASTGGSALAEVPLQRRNTVAAQTAIEANTNGGLPGAPVYQAWWNISTTFIYHPTPETRIMLDSGSVNFLVSALSGTDLNTSGTIIWEEF